MHSYANSRGGLLSNPTPSSSKPIASTTAPT
jgi:hypothetical protein